MLKAFSDQSVEYLLVGAYAVAVHGYPRATGDIDLYVRPTTENAERVISALRTFGAPLSGVSTEDFTTPGVVYQVGRAPNRIDLITALDGVSWEEAWSGHSTQLVGGISIPVIGVSALLRNKKATGRPKDLADLAWFEAKMQNPSEDP
jgi:hypothetical protein